MHTHSAAVYGASGYSGAELLRYLSGHPGIRVTHVTAGRHAGKRVGELYPHLLDHADLVLQTKDDPADTDLAFLCLPHEESARMGPGLPGKVVDVSAAFRLADPAAFQERYGFAHPGSWTYGLTELHREEVAAAQRVANPGCYPTAAVLALKPGISTGLLGTRVIVDAASGVSGAGRSADASFGFAELDASYSAYAVGKHRHTPEMEQELGCAVTFTPHLAPMARGILATCYAPLEGTLDDLTDIMRKAYADEAFVHVVNGQPATKHVSGTNLALIGVAADVRTKTAVITCAIDNLGKGAAGQAIQNANLMLGLPETSGLQGTGVFP